jgi:D-arabinose 1-dehydrogenase-like Zn-dependent alcohol dehydrogenase
MIGTLLKKSMELMEQGHIQPPQLQCFNASEVERAFKELQSSDFSGRVIIKP